MSDISLIFHDKCSNSIYLSLYDEFPDWRQDGIELSDVLVSEYKYEGLELYPATGICRADVYVNDDNIGYFYKNGTGLQFMPANNLPFLTYFGYVSIKVVINYEDNSNKTLYTKYINIISKNQELTDNAKFLLEELEKYNDSVFGDWVFNQFPTEQKSTKYSYWLGSLRPKSGRYLEAYIELLKSVMNRYRENFCFFKVNAYHKIEYQKKIISYEKIRRCAQNDFQWLMQNADCFAPVNQNVGIQYRNKNYIPINILGDKQYKNFDIYENQVVINFLRTVIQNCDYVNRELSKQIANKNEILKKQINVRDTYSFSILTLKGDSLEKWNKQLSDLKREFQMLWVQYSKLLPLRQTALLKHLPHTTKVFQEVRHYRDIFDVVRKWFDFGEFSINRINAMLKIKTMDTLYEYYCLYQILEMLSNKGWQPITYGDFAYYFNYGTSYGENGVDNEICNTYRFQKGENRIVLYYQPKIFGWERANNGLQLFRTTMGNNSEKQSFWQPDFVIKLNIGEDEKYVILDAKYASDNAIVENRLPKCIEKYINQISGKYDPYAVKMMGLLHGKASENDDFINYNNSLMSEHYYKGPIIGVVPLNIKNNFNILYDKLLNAFDIKSASEQIQRAI